MQCLIKKYASCCCSEDGQAIRMGTQDVEQNSKRAGRGIDLDLVAKGKRIRIFSFLHT